MGVGGIGYGVGQGRGGNGLSRGCIFHGLTSGICESFSVGINVAKVARVSPGVGKNAVIADVERAISTIQGAKIAWRVIGKLRHASAVFTSGWRADEVSTGGVTSEAGETDRADGAHAKGR